ncbi:MAG: lytic transglycosylase domain-containing protein [Parvularcula sp.]|jgi:hypothetical protein|nr:lytic transglycosylase domain-containing protein [Parvularcula sp.]
MKKLILTALVALSGQAAGAQEARLERYTLQEPASFRLLVPGQAPNPETDESPTIADAQSPSSSDPNELTSIDLGTLPVRPYVPAWMRGSRSAFEAKRSATLAHVPIPDCLTHGYFPRFDISEEAEARRRLYFDHIVKAACEAGVPVPLFDALVSQESRYRPFAKSYAGAMGMAQLMPGTARYLDVSNPWDPLENLRGGARYLREQLDRYGSWDLALAAYNSGPGRVDKYGGIPPFRETRNYVRAILASLRGTNSRFAALGSNELRNPSRRAQLAFFAVPTETPAD